MLNALAGKGLLGLTNKFVWMGPQMRKPRKRSPQGLLARRG
jgi:hypothetical protein